MLRLSPKAPVVTREPACIARRRPTTVGVVVVSALSALMFAPPVASADSIAVSRITGASPFPASCPQTFPQFPDAEAEFTLAADPRNPSRLTTAWLQAPLASEVAGFSRDGGRTFKPVVLPSLQRCTGGPFELSVDGTISEGVDGITYLATITDPNSQFEFGDLWVSRSRDQGRSWLSPVFVEHSNNPDQADDQPSLTADPFMPGRAYVVWSERVHRSGPDGKNNDTPELMFSRTTDGGAHWSNPRPVAPEPPSLGVATGKVVVPAPGRLVCVYTVRDVYSGTFLPQMGKTTTLLAASSPDGGRTWRAPIRVGTTPTLQPNDPDTGKLVRAMAAHDFAATADTTGDVYAAWTDIRRSGSTLRFVSTRNSGLSWSHPRNITGKAVEPLFPVLATAPDGTIGLTFYDWRSYRRGSRTLTTQAWFRRSRNHGRNWRESHPARPFDLRQAPYLQEELILSGYFLGEYQGLTGVPGGFVAAFAQARPQAIQGQLDRFAARIRVTSR